MTLTSRLGKSPSRGEYSEKTKFFFFGLKKMHNSGEIGDLSNLSKSIELICQCLAGCNNRNYPANKARSAQSAICNLCFSMIGFAITVIPVIRLFLNSSSKASQKRAFSRDVSLGCLWFKENRRIEL